MKRGESYGAVTESYVSVIYYRPLLNGLFYVLRENHQTKRYLLVHIRTYTASDSKNRLGEDDGG
jgi:hypothetical protein